MPYWFFLLLLVFLIGCSGMPGGSGGNIPASASPLRIASSPVLLPLISAAVALFERQHPDARIAIQRAESTDGLSSLADRQVDIAATALYADPAAAAPHIRDALIGVVPYLIVVPRGVQVASLSQAQILGIFSTGQITDWKQPGGPAQKLVVLLPPLTSDTRFVFREEVLGGADEVGAALSADSLETLRDLVARTPGSISYLPAPLLTASVQAVAINGDGATAEEIAAGQYGFWSFAHLYTWDTSASGTGETALFLQFMLSSAEAQLARQLGYIPLSEMPAVPVSV